MRPESDSIQKADRQSGTGLGDVALDTPQWSYVDTRKNKEPGFLEEELKGICYQLGRLIKKESEIFENKIKGLK
jgi:hypothetical protein